MKKKIHPTWYNNAKVTCSCGNTFTTGSTQEEIEVEICSQCHPFFTGEMKFVDRQGRVDKFKKKMQQAKKRQQREEEKRQKKQAEEQPDEDSRSYQDILRQAKSNIRQQSKPDDDQKK